MFTFFVLASGRLSSNVLSFTVFSNIPVAVGNTLQFKHLWYHCIFYLLKVLNVGYSIGYRMILTANEEQV